MGKTVTCQLTPTPILDSKHGVSTVEISGHHLLAFSFIPQEIENLERPRTVLILSPKPPQPPLSSHSVKAKCSVSDDFCFENVNTILMPFYMLCENLSSAVDVIGRCVFS